MNKLKEPTPDETYKGYKITTYDYGDYWFAKATKWLGFRVVYANASLTKDEVVAQIKYDIDHKIWRQKPL